MAKKYLQTGTGAGYDEVEGLVTSAGAGDAGKFPALDAAGKLDVTMMPTGIAPDVSVVLASENLADGDFVNIYNDAGTAKCRKSDGSTTGKHAHGFVKASVSSAANATVYHEGANDHVTGLTPGDQFLDGTTAGLTSHTAPTGSGKTKQRVGVAVSATSINVELGPPTKLA